MTNSWSRVGGMLVAIGVGAALLAVPARGRTGEAADARTGSTQLGLKIRVSPAHLPDRRAAPARLRLAMTVGAPERSPSPPALRHLVFELDRSVRFDLGQYPACPVSGASYGIRGETRERLAKCRRYVVGKGVIHLSVLLEGMPPIPIRREFTLYKVKSGDRPPTLIGFLEFPTPIPSEIVVPIEIRHPKRGRYGTVASLTIPKIVNGAGSITSFRFHLGKGVGYRHTPRSLIRARCPDGHLDTRAQAIFADETQATTRASQPCSASDIHHS